MLTASDVWFGYAADRPALKGVSITVAPDAVVGILGPNGSGKTTLLRVLAGTRHPQRGTVLLDGAPLAQTPRALLARRLAVVPQETQLAFDYTVAEVAMMGRYPHLGAFEIEGPRDVAMVEAALASTGTRHLQDRLFATLSGGEKQRVVIASALAQIGEDGDGGVDGVNGTSVTNGGTEQRSSTDTIDIRSSPFPRSSVCEARPVPPVPSVASVPVPSVASVPVPSVTSVPVPSVVYLLLDEPTASLDLAYQLEVAALVRDIHRQGRAGIVISTHDIGLAGTLCDTLVLLREGAVVASGATADVLTPENLQRVYGVETEISRHASGQLVVVPIRRSAGEPRA